MDNTQDILDSSKKINKMYEHIGYFDEYGGSVLLFILITILLFVGHSYSVVMMNMKPIKDDWPAQRCNPKVIPFAGLINKPANMSVSEYTNENFQYCIQDILTSISGYAVQPITYASSLLQDSVAELSQATNFMNNMMANIRTNMTAMGENTMNRVANVLVPLQRIVIGLKDFMEKIKAIFTSALYTSLGTYYTLQSFIGAIGELLIIILIILSILIVGFWLMPFTWPFAVSMTSIFISVSIPLAIMLAFMSEVLHVNIDMQIPQVPSKPNMCFDASTLLKMNGGEIKRIIDIEVGDVLEYNNPVTAKLLLDGSNVEMYNLNGVIVTGCHCVKYQNIWIIVSKHPEAKRIKTYSSPKIYCLNTSKKVIEINNMTFFDWDEIYDNHEKILQDVVSEKYEKLFKREPGWIHRYLDGGFVGSTLVSLKENEKREIKNINIGDILENKEVVIGIVEIDGDELHSQNKYCFGNSIIEGGPNLQVCGKDKIFSTLDKKEGLSEKEKEKEKEPIVKQKKLYHLLTDKGTFNIEGIQFKDYNSVLELFLE